ncbi:MAG: 4Fe-4S binding protein [Synergistaceae bacterium]|jgi:Pyruvate/2-oxoacid:ferredoxin oxidoreductase delta subunit|nr:4Fe-4S binding protein [Synergistaceae bacterium]
MREEVINIFEIPHAARGYIDRYLSREEIGAILKMGKERYGRDELVGLLEGVVDAPERFVSDAYRRAVFDKVEEDGVVYYKIANFYRRLAYFSQYEPDAWKAIPKESREGMEEWYLGVYAEGARPRLEESLREPGKLIENAFFYTLEETLDLIDRLDNDEFVVVPCNCKAVSLRCEDRKPQNVCLQLYDGINTDWDRGHGRHVNKNEAKDLIRWANKNGLMQTTEMGYGICNCCGCCCYPIRASRIIGAKGLWPRKMYDIVWNEKACIKCGKCANICNFGAFSKEGGISFDREKCWSCTICANHCPSGAITLRSAE